MSSLSAQKQSERNTHNPAARHNTNNMEDKIDKSLLQQASVIGQDTYYRPLTEQEKLTINETITGIVMRQDALAEEKKATMADIRDREKDLKEERSMYTKQKRTGRVEEAGKLYTFFVVENERKMAYIYNEEGLLVNSRGMRGDEIKDHQHMLTEQAGIVKLTPAANG